MAISMFGAACTRGSVDFKSFPSPATDIPFKEGEATRVATLAGGCFWCTEGVYQQIPGVLNVVSGYSGGAKETANYEAVCGGRTGHAEAIQITYDPKLISYGQILKVFFSVAHDPTTLNRQGHDVGPQYRSAIFYHSPEQRAAAEAAIAALTEARAFTQPIVTEVAPYTAFYPAEAYHQEYYRHNGQQPYCQLVIAPKVAKFRRHFGERLKA